MVLIQAKAEIILFGGAGLRGEKTPDVRVPLVEFLEKRSEPAGELAAFR